MPRYLPGLNGVDALKILRTVPETVYAMPRDVSAGLHSGFFLYITKSINIEELNEVIDSALSLAKTQGEEHPLP